MSRVCIVTNNPMVRDALSGKVDIDFREGSYLDVLVFVRDRIHEGSLLLTHPLSGSVKPGETPYKSILLELRQQGSVDTESLSIIENAIVVSRRLIEASRIDPGKLPLRVQEDFQLIDRTLIESALPSAGL